MSEDTGGLCLVENHKYCRPNLHSNAAQTTTSRGWGAKKFLDSLLRPALRSDEAHNASDVSPRVSRALRGSWGHRGGAGGKPT